MHSLAILLNSFLFFGLKSFIKNLESEAKGIAH